MSPAAEAFRDASPQPCWRLADCPLMLTSMVPGAAPRAGNAAGGAATSMRSPKATARQLQRPWVDTFGSPLHYQKYRITILLLWWIGRRRVDATQDPREPMHAEVQSLAS
jgi:hypothetical protein